MADDFDGWTRRASFAAKREVVREIRRQAERVKDAIAEAAAHGETGKLAESVTVRRGRNTLELVVTVGGDLTTKPVRKGAKAEYDYALAVEFGNEHAPAQPFAYPTFREMESDVIEAIGDAVARGVESA